MILNKYIWLIDRTLTVTTTPGRSEPGSNDNKGVLHTPQISWTEEKESETIHIASFDIFRSHTHTPIYNINNSISFEFFKLGYVIWFNVISTFDGY